MMAALVTGATGFIGQYLVQRLLTNGTTVRVLTRDSGRIPAAWHGRVQVVLGDLMDKSMLSAVVEGVDLIYHLAGEIGDKNRFYAVNHVGTRNLLESCVAKGLTRFLYLSSVGVIGAGFQGEYDEKSPCHPLNAYERSKFLGEQAMLEFYRDSQLPVTIVRPTIVFGPRPTPANDSFLSWMKAIKSGRFRFIGSGDAFANYVFMEDVVESCIHLIHEQSAVGEVYHVADPFTIKELVDWAITVLDVRMPGYLPTWMAYTSALVLQVAGKVGCFTPPLTLSRVRALTNRSVFLGNKLRQMFEFPVGWRKGLERTIASYQTMGLL